MISTASNPPPGVEVVQTRTAKLWLGEDGILRMYCLPGSVHGLAEAKENITSFRHRVSKKVPLLIDLREISAISREAREFFRSPENDSITATAILVDSPLSVAIGNFSIGLSQMAVEHRLFTSEEQALAWLKGYLE